MGKVKHASLSLIKNKWVAEINFDANGYSKYLIRLGSWGFETDPWLLRKIDHEKNVNNMTVICEKTAPIE